MWSVVVLSHGPSLLHDNFRALCSISWGVGEIPFHSMSRLALSDSPSCLLATIHRFLFHFTFTLTHRNSFYIASPTPFSVDGSCSNKHNANYLWQKSFALLVLLLAFYQSFCHCYSRLVYYCLLLDCVYFAFLASVLFFLSTGNWVPQR